jgi:transcriptional regulator with XRE-family HTH domain
VEKTVTNAQPDIQQNTPSDLNTVRTNLRIACALRDMTNLSEIARRCGYSRNIVSQFAAGKTSISHAHLLGICDVIKVPIGILHIPDAITQANISTFQNMVRDIQAPAAAQSH